MTRFDLLRIGTEFTHPQFGDNVFVKESFTTAILTENGEKSRFTPTPSQPVNVTREPTPQTIELDCAPGYPRPGDLIDAVIADTGLEPREAVGKFFGNWTWDYSDVSPTEWMRIRRITGPRIKALHAHGHIRYGSW